MLNLKSRLKTSTSKLRAWAKRGRDDESGIAAIEFALIAPVMLMFYFGLAEVSLLVSADRRVSQSSSLIGDLAAQDPVITLDMMEDYINASLAVNGLNREDALRLGIEMYSIEARSEDTDGDGVDERILEEIGFAKFGPAYADNGTKFDASNVDMRLLPEGSGVIVARVRYGYESPYRYFVKDMILRETFLLKPRRSATVEFDTGVGAEGSNIRKNMRCLLFGNPSRVRCVADPA